MAEAMHTACNDLLRPDAQSIYAALNTIEEMLTKGDAAGNTQMMVDVDGLAKLEALQVHED